MSSVPKDNAKPKGSVRIAMLQYCAGADKAANLAVSLDLFALACNGGADLVALPEAADRLDPDPMRLAAGAMALESHDFVLAYQRAARDQKVHVLVGSVTARDGHGRVVNRSVLVGPDGSLIATYDKIHLFDAPVTGGSDPPESAIYAAGNQARLASVPWGRIGMTICYDLRFPALYRRLARGGASLLFIPSAFMRITGEAHWHVLLRARAIENGCFVIAPAQCGSPYAGRESYGHSLAVDPWGRVLVDAGEASGVVWTDVDLGQVQAVRARLPSLNHERAFELTS